MASVVFYPIHWYEDASWDAIQTLGQLRNGSSVYVRIPFAPYFTARCRLDDHSYLLDKTPITQVHKIGEDVYRLHVANKKDYDQAVAYVETLGEVLDKDQDIKTKFFIERGIRPASWLIARDVQTPAIGTGYADLEYYTENISVYSVQWPPMDGRLAFVAGDTIMVVDGDKTYNVDDIMASRPVRIVTMGHHIDPKTRSVSHVDLADVFAMLYPYATRYTTDSVQEIYDLWVEHGTTEYLASIANLWMTSVDRVLTTPPSRLFTDLVQAFEPLPCACPKARLESEAKTGVYRDVYLYSTSDLCLDAIARTSTLLASKVVQHFRGSNMGVVPYRSGYFPVDKIRVPDDEILWLRDHVLVTKTRRHGIPAKRLPIFIIWSKSCVIVDEDGNVYKHGLSRLVRPPFTMVDRYLDYLIDHLVKHKRKRVVFPKLELELDDFAMETKVTPKDLESPLVQQMLEHKITIERPWHQVRYIKTRHGLVIEDIYSKDPEKYIRDLDLEYYNRQVREILAPLVS